MGGTRHVTSIDFNDLISGLQSPITSNETIREDFLDYDTSERSIGATNDGQAKSCTGPWDFHMRNFSFKNGETGDTCKMQL